ncbi:MAG: hypothetical protein DLM67_05415 [Candidatus Nephthysia bennettiae]|nr:MAG: hypothetical protein DLM67_05415 [Candidatus Dormibacteraeota bacterium]
MSEEAAVGLFADREQAEECIRLLHAQGFAIEDMSLLMQGDKGAGKGDDGEAPDVVEGAATGGLLGGIGGLLLGAGLLLIPGVGPVLAAGPLLTALGGAALGAGTGLVATLTNAGVSEGHAKRIEEQVSSGSVLVTVAPTPRHEEARALLCQAGATETDFSLTGEEP